MCLGGKAVLDEKELSAGFQNTPDFGKSLCNIMNAAERPGCDDGIDDVVIEWNLLGAAPEDGDR